MSSISKPTVVFFAGACADPTCFDRIRPLFEASGYPVVYVRVPSLNPSDAASITCANDAKFTREQVLLPLIETQHKDIIVFVHSYGGVVGEAAAAGLSKVARTSRNEAGGIIGLMYLAGNIVAEGGKLLEAIGGVYPTFLNQGKVRSGFRYKSPLSCFLCLRLRFLCSRDLALLLLSRQWRFCTMMLTLLKP